MRLAILFILIGAFSRPIEAKPVGKASFLAIGEGLAIDIEGEGAVVDSTVKKTGDTISGTFSVNLADFKTGISLRDEHLCKALECKLYPKATFTITAFTLRDGDSPFEGTLDLHGQKKPFRGVAKVRSGKVSAEGKLKLTDFGITPPEYKLARVSNDVEVKVELAL